MIMDYEDFNRKFHSLEGITLKEKKKSLYYLLKSITPSNSHTLDVIIQKLTALTYLEEAYKIEFLLYFKRTIDLLNILKNGEEIGANKIVHQDWFVKELMDMYTPTQFFVEVVPNLSFSIRSKIFRRILVNVKNENVIEEFFEKILNRYGISSALLFLPGCSNEKIIETFEKFSLKLSANQLKFMFKKERDLIVKYFEILIANGSNIDEYKWRSFFSYLGKQDPLFYFEICEKFHIEKLKLGRESSKKYIESRREKIINEPYDHYKLLRKDVLVRKLGTDFPVFYKNLLPDSLYQFRFFSAKSIIKYYPKNKQYQLYFDTFEEVYEKSLWDNVEYMDEKLIEFIPDIDEREKWVSKFENRQNIKKYMVKKRKYAMFFREDYEENVIKEKKTIFNTLISTCKLTKDYDAFLNILKSFCDRHRNSDVTVIYNFLRTIHKELNLEKFKNEHWQYIYYIFSIQLFKKQQIYHPLFLEYIKFQFISQKPINEYILTLLNEAPLNLSKFVYNNKDFEKASKLLFLHFLPEISNRQNEIAIQIALSIMKWNAKYPAEYICFSDQEIIVNAVMELKSNEKINKNVMKVFRYLICRQKGDESISVLEDIYWCDYELLNDYTITNWFLKYKPIVIKQHLNKIGAILKNKNINFIRNLKKLNHIEIPNSITALCLQELKICEPTQCSRLIRILVLFMEKNELLSFMNRYIPKLDEKDVDMVEENARKHYAIQCSLAKYSKLFIDAHLLLPTLLKYCKGNVLSSSLPSLYSTFHRVPENQLYSALQELENKAVSVRKHSIFLTSLILPTTKILSTYNKVQLFEKNISVRQHMFSSCFKYFIKVESPEFWEILKKFLEQLEKGCKDVLKIIRDVHLIPKTFRAEYTELVWNILEKFKSEKSNIDDNMHVFLNNLTTKDFDHLNIEFCCSIVENKLFDFVEFSMDDTVSDFSQKFFLGSGNSKQKVDSLVRLIHEIKGKTFHDDEKHREFLLILHKFCFRLFTDILSTDTEILDLMFPKYLKEALIEMFRIEDIFEEIMLLDLVLLKTESSNFKQSLPRKMNTLFTSVVEKYRNLITKRFGSFLNMILNIVYKEDETNLLMFLNSFLEENSTKNHCALVIKLLPYISNSTDTQSSIDAYKLLLKKLNEQDQIIKICLYGKLKQG